MAKTIFFTKEIISIKIQPTSSHSVELRSSFHSLASFLGKLILKPLLLGGYRLADLLELSPKVDNPLFFLRLILQQDRPNFGSLCQQLSQGNKIVSTIPTMQNQVVTTRSRQLTVDTVLIVTMLVRKACMSSLSSNQSSCQGV
jgi:hypothetical protein